MFDLFITKSIAIWDALERFRACKRAILERVCVLGCLGCCARL